MTAEGFRVTLFTLRQRPNGTMQNAVNDIYPFRVPEFVEIYDLTWEDVAQCARDGYTIKDTAAVLGVTAVNMRTALKRRPDIRAMFPSHGVAALVSMRGYSGSKAVGTLVCPQCGKTGLKYGVRQKYCSEVCKREAINSRRQAARAALPEDKKIAIKKHNREYAKAHRVPNPGGKRYVHPWRVKSWGKIARELSD